MLYEFITLHRDAIVARTRDRLRGRPWPSVSSGEIEHGVPLFLAQLSETLRLEATATPFLTAASNSGGYSGGQNNGPHSDQISNGVISPSKTDRQCWA